MSGAGFFLHRSRKNRILMLAQIRERRMIAGMKGKRIIKITKSGTQGRRVIWKAFRDGSAQSIVITPLPNGTERMFVQEHAPTSFMAHTIHGL